MGSLQRKPFGAKPTKRRQMLICHMRSQWRRVEAGAIREMSAQPPEQSGPYQSPHGGGFVMEVDMSTQRQIVSVSGKDYTVKRLGDGSVEITASWRAIVPHTAMSAHPEYTYRRASVSLHGRTGKQVLAAIAKATSAQG